MSDPARSPDPYAQAAMAAAATFYGGRVAAPGQLLQTADKIEDWLRRPRRDPDEPERS